MKTPQFACDQNTGLACQQAGGSPRAVTASLKRSGSLTWLAVVGALALACCPQAKAQMVTGAGMTDFKETFGLSAKGWSVQQTGCSLGANILWPGEEADFTFYLKPGQPWKGRVRVEVVPYGTRAAPGDMWKPIVFKIAEAGGTSAEVDLAAEGGFVTVHPRIGDKFGGYGLIFDLGERGRAFGAACVRVPKAEPGRERLPTYALDLPWPHERTPFVYQVFKRLGVKGARVEGGYNSIGEAHIDWAMENNITLMLCVGAANTPTSQMPLGRGRPWLNEDGSMKTNVKEDLAWLPSFDPEFKRYVKEVIKKYGWPKGPINAVELWNEPWEGVSISGWGADIPRYREMFKAMAEGVDEARSEGGLQVLIGGACSSANTRDKLFADGQQTFLPYLDFVSIHYQPMAADPALVPEWVNRRGRYGRVQVWDTESWVANSEDKVAAVIASMRAMGQDRTAGIYGGNVFEGERPRINGKEYDVVQVWSPGAAVAACQQFIGQRPFREILFKNGLPWIFVFEGRAGQAEDGSVVVVGNLAPSYSPGRVLHRSVALAAEARMEITDGGGRYILHDFYGNPLPAQNGRIAIPLNGLGYFIRANGAPGSFAALLAELKKGDVSGVAPVEITARDLIAPIASKPSVRLRLTNVLPRPVKGRLAVSIEELALSPAEQELALGANESKDVLVTVTGGMESPRNNYKLLATYDAAGAGTTKHAEVIHVNVIARRTITVDGNADDWKGVIPQDNAQTVGASDTEKAYLPFKDWSQQVSSGGVTAWLAADEQAFYFAARVPRMDGLLRYETRDDDAFFYPEKVRDKDRELTWPADTRRFSYRKDFDIPSGNGKHNVQIAFNVIPAEQKAWLPFPAGTMPGFCACLDTDYEFALNKVGEEYGGGTEIFCLQRPGMMRKHFFPRQARAEIDGGPVKGAAKLVVKGNFVECALPWPVIPEVRARLKAGLTVKFSFRVNNGNGAFELAAHRSVSKENPFAFHNEWSTHWANEVEFAWEKKQR